MAVLVRGPGRGLINTAETIVHEIGHSLGMKHDFASDDTSTSIYKYTICKTPKGSDIPCDECSNYQATINNNYYQKYQRIGPITGNKNDCCNGFMGYYDHPNYWSQCSVRAFEQHYVSENWSRCMTANTESCNPDFVDNNGDSCKIYAMNEWCDPSGGYGSKWKDKWGTFEERSKNGQNANFCPQCGCKACTKDEDCDTSNCFYCLSTGICSQYNREYCDDNNCGHGDGDCDLTGGKDYYDQPIVDNCSYETACGINNFLEIHPLLENCKGISTADACVTKRETCTEDRDCNTDDCFYCLSSGLCHQYDGEYCDTNTCGINDGDCDYDDDQCPSGSYCGRNNFLKSHPLLKKCKGTSSAEVCVASSNRELLHP